MFRRPVFLVLCCVAKKKDFICLKTVPAWAQLMRTCLKAGRLWRARSSRTRVPQTYEDQPYRSYSKERGIITSKYLSHTWLHFWHSSSFSMLVFSSRAWMMWKKQGIFFSAKCTPGHRAFPQVCLPYPSPLCHSQRRHESWQTPRLGNAFFSPCITFSVNPRAWLLVQTIRVAQYAVLWSMRSCKEIKW